MPRHRTRIVCPLALALLGCAPPLVPVLPAAAPRPPVPGPTAPAPTPASSPAPPRAEIVPPTSPMPTAPPDTWLAFGDSITQDAFRDLAPWQSSFIAPPLAINAGVRGNTTLNALMRADALLAGHPEARYVGLAFGTNDAAGQLPLETFQANMHTLVDKVRSRGMAAMIARIPFSADARLSGVPAYNQAIDALTGTLALAPGPDLYALVQQNPNWLGPDGVHMTPAGNQGILAAWARSARALGAR